MKKFTSSIAFLLLVVTYGQEKVNQKGLQSISEEARAEYNQALQLAATKYADHPVDEGVSLQAIEYNTPVYFQIDSRPQVKSMNLDFLSDGSMPGVSATGSGFIGYIWDGGKVRLTHQEFGNRAIQIETTGSVSDHATGVANVMIGNGASPLAIGMAPEALLKVLNFTNGSTTDEMADQSADSDNSDYMISNHSYGALTGWAYNSGQQKWYWYGYPSISEVESPLFGFYTNTDRKYDEVAFNAPQHSIFKSSGNNHEEGPDTVVDHYALDDNGQWQLFSGVFRPKDCLYTEGYDCLSYSGTVAKNVIAVAAVKNLADRYQGPESVKMTSFSSWGPTDDGRIKPELSAIGENVKGANATADDAYTNWSGTSFSSPAAAGVGLILEEVKFEYNGGYLRSDMMKALLVNSANEAGDDLGPDYKFGFGLIDAMEAARTIINSDFQYFTKDTVLLNDANYSLSFVANGNLPLKATIAWIDPPGTPLTTMQLNNRTPMLVNDLDLRITQGSNTYFPWKLDPDNPSEPATREDNSVDNLEQIYIENPVAGQTYNLSVSHKGSLVNGQQYFALVVSGINSENIKTTDFDLNKSISVFPNPVADKLNIHSQTLLKNVHIKIFNEMGVIIYDKKVDSIDNTETINLNSVPSGVYMVYIKSNQGTVTKKIIKK